MQLAGLHHVTCVCSEAQRTLDFYRDLGFTLVKKTVNFDDPHSYHLYFGDETGSPGTLITFFEWPRADAGRLGRGTLESIGLETPLADEESEVEDPDGLRLRLYPGSVPRLRDVTVIGNPDLYVGLFAADAPLQFAEPLEEPALIGAGTTHHIAWRAKDDAEQQAWLRRLAEVGLRPTPVQDRKYFRSVYFRMPDGILIEIATDEPGFLVDEPLESLGQGLSLPPWLEPERETLQRELTRID
ncbi:MAG: Glyoxalase/bleomycin resistance protein/dioxygenase [Actinomycetia bacterium]|nr:Glyoxalase/bleomycin resistance protein/dioxygenase [Actinomycetes bacterium]